jgi:NDP-sugar pyrophosphorylase family protein
MPATQRCDIAAATAIVLAGGFGTRLAPVVPDRPKALAEVAGRPFLAYVLDRLATVGVRHVVLATGHRGEQVEAAFGDRHRDIRLVYSREREPAGTGGALALAAPFVQSATVLALNGDSLCDVDLRAFWAWHHARGSHATMVLADVPDARRYGHVTCDAGGRVVAFAEKGAGGPGTVNAGMYALHAGLLRTIPTDRAVSLEHDLLPAWIGRGLHGFASGGALLDIGTPEDFAAAGHRLDATRGVPT